MGWRYAALLAGALLVAACTVDDDVVEGKTCYPTGSDPDKMCVQGYECKCELGECTCQKKAELTSASSGLRVEQRSTLAVDGVVRRPMDPSQELLLRLGLDLR